jgi:Tfp pilus assembly protein PilV
MKHNFFLKQPKFQSGQSLIETIIAIFVLTMALTTALGLAVYSLSSSSLSQNQIIAVNLAREGIDVVRAMRDSNWLAGDASTDASFNLTNCADLGGRLCYPKALAGPTYTISAGIFRANFDIPSKTWSLDTNSSYDLYLQINGVYTHAPTGGTPVFARKLVVSFNTAAPYTATNPEVIIQSIVGWRDKNCTPMTSSDPSTTNCSVVGEEHMTNWKDYR